MSVPDEAVEAAAEAAGLVFGEPANARDLAYIQTILTAAAPFIAAQAWDEGMQAGHDHMIGKHSSNPYRSGT